MDVDTGATCCGILAAGVGNQDEMVLVWQSPAVPDLDRSGRQDRGVLVDIDVLSIQVDARFAQRGSLVRPHLDVGIPTVSGYVVTGREPRAPSVRVLPMRRPTAVPVQLGGVDGVGLDSATDSKRGSLRRFDVACDVYGAIADRVVAVSGDVRGTPVGPGSPIDPVLPLRHARQVVTSHNGDRRRVHVADSDGCGARRCHSIRHDRGGLGRLLIADTVGTAVLDLDRTVAGDREGAGVLACDAATYGVAGVRHERIVSGEQGHKRLGVVPASAGIVRRDRRGFIRDRGTADVDRIDTDVEVAGCGVLRPDGDERQCVVAVAGPDETTQQVPLRRGGVKVEFLRSSVIEANQHLAHVRTSAAEDLDDVAVEGNVRRSAGTL